MEPRYGLRWLTLLWPAIAACAGMLAVGAWLTGAIEPLFARLVALVASRMSDDGIISSRGMWMLRNATRILAELSLGISIAAAYISVSLRGLLASPEAPSAGPLRAHAARRGVLLQRSVMPAVWGLLVLAALLRIPRLPTSLFYDEIFTIQHFAKLPLVSIPFVQIESNNHILNSLFLHPLLSLSSRESLLRLPVYVAGIGSLWLLYELTRSLSGPIAGLLALWLAATSPFHLSYSTLARGYMLGLFFSLLGLVVLWRSAEPPRRSSLWAFALSQLLAGLAVPFLAIVPLGAAIFLLAGRHGRCGAVTGIHPATRTGRAWLCTSLWTLVALGLMYAPTSPRWVLRMSYSDGDGGSLLTQAAEWLGFLRIGWIGTVGILAAAATGLAVLVRRCRAAGMWKLRLVLAIWGAALLLLVANPVPIRIHVLAFAAVVLLVAGGLQAWLRAVVHACVPAAAHRLAWGVATAALVAVIGVSSREPLVEAARGVPIEDVRGAVRTAESWLPDDGVIVTSGFGDQELAYYARLPVKRAGSVGETSSLLTGQRPFCYVRLYTMSRGNDDVFALFASLGPPTAVMEGQDSIPVWCFRDARPLPIQASNRHPDEPRG